ncbi:MAG: hypothetical protein M3235_11680 [Actinomycetota bacterium]|nr:hypothetical protein [Actinomycetota bacterium]
MSTGSTIAATVLVITGLLIGLAWRARGVGPLVVAGAVLGVAAGVSATLLFAGLT